MSYVDVVFIQDWDGEVDEHDAPELSRTTLDAAAEYCAQWDYGTETDDAHTMPGDVPTPGQDVAYPVNVNGQAYTLIINWALRYASLTRAPLKVEA